MQLSTNHSHSLSRFDPVEVRFNGASLSHTLHRPAYLLLIIIILVPILLMARDSGDSRIESLRKNPHYLSALGEGADLEAARRLAEKALVSQIQVAIGVTSSYTSNAVEDQNVLKLTTEFVTRHQSYAGMLFKGLSYIESQQKDNWSVFAYIHRDSLSASYAYQKSKIVGLTSAGIEAVKRGGMGEGLKSLHQAWLLSHFYPDTISFSALPANLPANPQVATAELISGYLARLDVAASDCYRDDPLIMAPLRLSLDGSPVRDLTISYYGGHGMEFARVLNGRADLPLSSQPISSQQRLLITIEYIFETELKSDAELAGLYEMFGSGDFPNLKTITLRFPWILPEPSRPAAPLIPPTFVSILSTSEPASPLPIRSLSEPLTILSSQHATPEFLVMLVQYSKLGALTYGRRSDFGDGIGCHVAVFDDNQIIAFLFFDGVQYRTLDDRGLYSELTDEFRGRRQVWIKETGK